MYKHLLLATDGSKLSAKAVTHAIALAQILDAKLTTFYASPDYPMPMYAEGMAYDRIPRKDYEAAVRKEAAQILDAVATKAMAGGVKCSGVHVIGGAPWEGILATARKAKCDAIVMASHGRRGISGLLLGSEAHKVLTHSKMPVLIVR
jgi:nucleotide-binding universal stress UspA family protein